MKTIIIATVSLLVVGIACAITAPLAGEHNPHHGFFNIAGATSLTIAFGLCIAGASTASSKF